MIKEGGEAVASSPRFGHPFGARGCLRPADGFYEWSKQGKHKSPFCFSMADDSIFAFAGIWDRWRDFNKTNPNQEPIETCSIITTAANALLSGIHDRMPVILKRDNHDL